jgi:MoxR-like ATPase
MYHFAYMPDSTDLAYIQRDAKAQAQKVIWRIASLGGYNEKDLPDAFLRRCFFHYIRFPDRDTLRSIVDVHFPNLHAEVLRAALDTFFALREAPGLKKKPSTSEFLDWLRLLIAEDVTAAEIDAHAATSIPMLAGALLKNEQDLQLLERLAAVTRNSTRRPSGS